ncbi:hypothetical protein LPC08_13410 [Roseomonas sp. OT10]|uniref:hypothetical protein n=1 Tax=Roseomonas cutis TaxID=2897332 RepID=UPI001E5B608A|nr:hypothetical protein [Roseomonas sp. OT10]UFN47025.1 hypothetical protein LPC08_13410 [Roseomonas sp. OT10]
MRRPPFPALPLLAATLAATLALSACGTPGAPPSSGVVHSSAALPQSQGRDMEAPFRNRPGDPTPVPFAAGSTGSPVDARSPAQGDVR